MFAFQKLNLLLLVGCLVIGRTTTAAPVAEKANSVSIAIASDPGASVSASASGDNQVPDVEPTTQIPIRYVGDREYAQILEKLEQEAFDSIENPANFVSDEDLDRVLRLLSDEGKEEKADDQQSTTLAPEKGASDLVAPPNQTDQPLVGANTTPAAVEADEQRAATNQPEVVPVATEQEIAPTTTTTEAPPTTRPPSILLGDEGAFVADDQFDQVLAKLKREAMNSIEHPANFVSDEELELVLKRLEQEALSPPDVPECAICHSELDENDDEDTYKMPNCMHTFHSSCIESWVNYRVSITRIHIQTHTCAFFLFDLDFN